ncbi:hypothetical protein DPMN_080539 [Dreissena polymorpha]|uniref:Uncharacterized protein n=1 Tax=Dreissena polymorpha TaxID=45954 RepID=A0A9D4BJB8_DREPO|nr:hypothetical protein DPMN_080539 [Dreissena polymorpha]
MFHIEQLLQAAEYLDRREREAEHGYASSLPEPDEYSFKKRSKSKKTQGNRYACVSWKPKMDSFSGIKQSLLMELMHNVRIHGIKLCYKKLLLLKYGIYCVWIRF